ncbi:glycerophosphodiester phosphodiesterase family protein [Francisella adeliensis]|uniref:Glycerophosphoryl diester phosphodiesterase n=1 Tax=Francisella adeliensis TaxID=2007306 RepID=A0A2Z4XZ70_9GAMM|nr:glycerophosphodiester phosphodiesterase family protein [Francisella adeliensis]AXA34070.1 glycerophosphoryl diester phosphodiesterase [Francisella adeliensis]MBK2085235.1 glycerophosphoryl diester phosphodiesterase [Francisella adeliensis]MBK2095997.1 glycerophosphoryl diester phosphodiesterase [Francisella adeliensis]QIW12310.1 glycerophosphoryl diester phosphodiesterase [Francisella adeliensis]QIW14184.1 glycerophosphoryl diester phosphodiesterase [Francisella adeliensis]
MNIDRFISHRGANTEYVENTIQSFQIAKDFGFKWFEIDVQMSLDGELFLFHDNDLKRLAGLDLKPTDLTIAQLKEIDVFHTASDTTDKIPTLKEYLDWAQQQGVYTNIELKISKKANIKYAENLVVAVINLLNEYEGINESIFISSFNKTAMKELKRYKKYKKGKLFEMISWPKDFDYLDTELYKRYKENNYLAIIINYDCLNRKRVQYLKNKFGKVFVFSVYTDYEVKKLLDWGVDAMFVDKKEQLKITL